MSMQIKMALWIASVLAVLAAIAGIAYAGYDHGVTSTNTSWQTKWDAQVIELQQARNQALDIARAEEKRRFVAIDEVRTNAQNEINQARADAIAADLAATGLREQAERLAKSASRCTSNTATSTRGNTADQPAVVLANVLSRSDQAAGELAKAYDDARARGLACERQYNAVRGERDAMQ